MENLKIAESSSKISAALWAVDPREQKLRPSPESLAEVRVLLGGSFAHLHPVYLCSEDITVEVAHVQVKSFLERLGVEQTCLPTVIQVPATDRKGWARSIVAQAHRDQDQMILLTSHGRSTLGNFFLGSFAQELMDASDVPLLFLSHQASDTAIGEQALFVTDFSASSKKAFFKFLSLTDSSAKRVLLCNVVNVPIDAYSAGIAAGVAIPWPGTFVEEMKDWSELEAASWIAQAKSAGITVQLQKVVHESMSTAAKAIQDLATEQNVSLIGLSSSSGNVSGGIWESVTHSLISAQKFNLWISRGS